MTRIYVQQVPGADGKKDSPIKEINNGLGVSRK
jgi:hypothetical protein